ncbi:MAG: DUF2892 domain-containing protein [Roseovarius sp.]|nr:DUF2892 domain-containing protein [Roseovarius sp.]
MLKKNVGKTDRIVRIVVGLALLAGFALNPGGTYSWLYLIGLIPLATGLMGSCPAYTLFGFSSCPLNRK